MIKQPKKETYTGSRRVLSVIYKIFSKLFLALLIVVAVFLLYVALSSKLASQKGMRPKFSLYTIISPSMYPKLKVYDIIVDVRVDDPTTIKNGDIITFISTSTISKGMTITHRVIDIVPDGNGLPQFQTKGDNNTSPDGAYALSSNVLGKVVFRVPQFGRIQYFLSQKGGWLLIIVIPALIIIFKDVIKLIKLLNVKEKVNSIDESANDFETKKKQEKMRKELLMKKFGK